VQYSERKDSMKNIWILGAGKFGRIACRRIVSHFPHSDVTVVDNMPEVHELTGVKTVFEDGVSWLVKKLKRKNSVDIIIPAIPLHVVMEWLKEKHAGKYHVSPWPLPPNYISQLPHPMSAGDSTVYVSHADFLCPDNCAEPKSICTYTGEKRAKDMFRLLQDMNVDGANSLVIRSYQLLPGVGGIYPQDLWNLLDRVETMDNEPLIIATACRCHGVVDGIYLT